MMFNDIRIIMDKIVQMRNIEYDVSSGKLFKYVPGCMLPTSGTRSLWSIRGTILNYCPI